MCVLAPCYAMLQCLQGSLSGQFQTGLLQRKPPPRHPPRHHVRVPTSKRSKEARGCLQLCNLRLQDRYLHAACFSQSSGLQQVQRLCGFRAEALCLVRACNRMGVLGVLEVGAGKFDLSEHRGLAAVRRHGRLGSGSAPCLERAGQEQKGKEGERIPLWVLAPLLREPLLPPTAPENRFLGF